MDFTEVIKSRYSCKKFDGRKVEQAQHDAILEAGRLAPTAKNLQEQHIYVHPSKDALTSSENQLRLANSKAEDLSVKRLTKNAPAVKAMFDNLAAEGERK